MRGSWLGAVKRLMARHAPEEPGPGRQTEPDMPEGGINDLNRGGGTGATYHSVVGGGDRWNPFIERRREGVEGPTYRARRRRDANELPQWDPFDEAWSRERRIREARQAARSKPTEQDYYAVLGISRGASDDEIEQAYRKFVARTHPDRFYDDPVRRGLAEAKLKELNAIMQVLRDPVRRALYDSRL